MTIFPSNAAVLPEYARDAKACESPAIRYEAQVKHDWRCGNNRNTPAALEGVNFMDHNVSFIVFRKLDADEHPHRSISVNNVRHVYPVCVSLT